MPHVVVEYTANLRAEADIPALLRDINAYLIAQRTDAGPVFPIGGIRSRAVRLDDYCIADGGDPDDAFVHVAMTAAAGRDAATMKRIHDGLFDLLKSHFTAIAAHRGIALSMEVGTFGEAGTWKHNNLHARVAARDAARAGTAYDDSTERRP